MATAAAPPPAAFRFPVYQIDFSAVAAGKHVSSTKRRIRWYVMMMMSLCVSVWVCDVSFCGWWIYITLNPIGNCWDSNPISFVGDVVHVLIFVSFFVQKKAFWIPESSRTRRWTHRDGLSRGRTRSGGRLVGNIREATDSHGWEGDPLQRDANGCD